MFDCLTAIYGRHSVKPGALSLLQVKMSLQLYQVDQKNYLLDFKSLNNADHPDAARVEKMTRVTMSSSSLRPQLEEGQLSQMHHAASDRKTDIKVMHSFVIDQ